MNDTQILTLAVSFCIPLGMLIFSNSRISDVKDGLRAEIKSAKLEVEAKISDLDNKVDRRLERLEAKIDERFHHVESRFQQMEARFGRIDSSLEAILKLLADHEARLPG